MRGNGSKWWSSFQTWRSKRQQPSEGQPRVSAPRLRIEGLEERLVPSGNPLDLTARGAVGEINGALFRQYDARPTGTGVIDSFVRLQVPNARTSIQQGYNTDARP